MSRLSDCPPLPLPAFLLVEWVEKWGPAMALAGWKACSGLGHALEMPQARTVVSLWPLKGTLCFMTLTIWSPTWLPLVEGHWRQTPEPLPALPATQAPHLLLLPSAAGSLRTCTTGRGWPLGIRAVSSPR